MLGPEHAHLYPKHLALDPLSVGVFALVRSCLVSHAAGVLVRTLGGDSGGRCREWRHEQQLNGRVVRTNQTTILRAKGEFKFLWRINFFVDKFVNAHNELSGLDAPMPTF